jgi:hypothetical protein
VLSLPGLGSYRHEGCGALVWRVSGAGSVLDLPGLTDVVTTCNWLYLQADDGGRINVNRLATIDRVNLAATANGIDSRLDLSGLVLVGSREGGQFTVAAQNGGAVDLHRLESISGNGCRILSDGAGSTVDLSNLSAFATPLGASELTGRNGGTIASSSSAVLLQNVTVNAPEGSLVLPSAVSAGPALSLYGQPWRSYCVEVRDTRDPASDWALFMRVPLTTNLLDLGGAPKPWQAFRAFEFTADPSILDSHRLADGSLQLVLYGAPPKIYEVESVVGLDAPAEGWTLHAVTGPMTNSFRIFPPLTPAEAQRFYRGREL